MQKVDKCSQKRMVTESSKGLQRWFAPIHEDVFDQDSELHQESVRVPYQIAHPKNG